MRYRRYLIAIAVIIISLVSFLGVSDMMFGGRVRSEVERMFADSKDVSDRVFSYQQIEGLPEPVQRYFKYALKDGQHYISYARLRHTGTLRTSGEQGWMPISGEEYFTTQEPAFVWYAKARVQPIPIMWIAARDMYFQGKGSMLIKLFSVYTMGDSRGREIDQGALVRYLAEAVWFPTALLPNEYLHWEPVDSNSAKALFAHRSVTVTAIFHFNEKGEVTRIEAERYAEIGGPLEKWSVYCTKYIEFGRVRLPSSVEAVWNLKSGDLSYARFEVTEIEFNKPATY